MGTTQYLLWADEALRTIRAHEAAARGSERARVRDDWARDHVADLEPSRIPKLVVALFAHYDSVDPRSLDGSFLPRVGRRELPSVSADATY